MPQDFWEYGNKHAPQTQFWTVAWSLYFKMGSCCVDQAGFGIHGNPSASASRMLGIQTCSAASIPSPFLQAEALLPPAVMHVQKRGT